jgi:hypothetical protein
VEWFKSSKRAAAPPAISIDVVAPEPPPTDPVAEPAPIRSPKAVFDSVADEPQNMRPLPAPAIGFTISSSRNGETGELQLTSPTLTVAKARMLTKSGWRVWVTNAAGRQFAPSEFDEILKFD